MGWASWVSSVQGVWNTCCTLGVKSMDRKWGQPLEQCTRLEFQRFSSVYFIPGVETPQCGTPISQSQPHSPGREGSLPACCFSLACVIPIPSCLVSKSISKGFLALTSAVFMVQQFWGQAIDPFTNKALKQMLKGFPGIPSFSLLVNPGIAKRIQT